MLPIHIIDRQSIIDRITQEYNEELYEIKTQFEKSKKMLDDKYNLTIKQVNAMYDAYEVTVSQLTVYRSMLNETNRKMVELLESNLANMPNIPNISNWENSIFNSQIYKNSDYINDTTVVSINLPYDIFEDPFSVLSYSKFKTKFPYVLKMKVNRDKYAFDITLNNINCYNFNCLVIKERDIIILWKNPKYFGENYFNFFKISTGELVYTYEYRVNGNFKFMYCNKQIICMHTTNTDDIVIITFNIDNHPVFSIQYRITQASTIKFNKDYNLSLDDFYSDIRGLYLYYKKYIYFLGKLESGTQFINLDNIVNKFHFNSSIDISVDIAQISDIDYAHGTIYIKTICHPSYGRARIDNYIVKLGVSDMFKLLY